MKEPAAAHCSTGVISHGGGEQKNTTARLRRCAQLKASERARLSPEGAIRGAEGQETPRTATADSLSTKQPFLLHPDCIYILNRFRHHVPPH